MSQNLSSDSELGFGVVQLFSSAFRATEVFRLEDIDWVRTGVRTPNLGLESFNCSVMHLEPQKRSDWGMLTGSKLVFGL